MAFPERGSNADEFENIVADAFRRAGWQVRRHPVTDDLQADLIVERATTAYVVQIKATSEGRRDRLIPLLSQGILEAQAFARQFDGDAAPLVVVAARRIPVSVAGQIVQFAHRHAPDVAIGVIDAEGYRSFAGPSLSGLDAKRSIGARAVVAPHHQPDLFSDLNQWMLKILVGGNLPPDLLSVPKERIRNASHLAEAASVSLMSSSRFVNQLAKQGFLDEDREYLRIVRIEELFERWASAYRAVPSDLPARWIIKKDEKQFLATLGRYASKPVKRNGRNLKSQHRCCIGLFAAADALGLGFVRGVPPHLYLERLEPDVLQQLGLSLENPSRGADVNIRIPSNRETVFRAAVSRDGIPVSDVLQVWLDTAAHPARGREQANEIWRRTLKPIFGKRA
jgi:hypothetical protein